MSRNRQIRWGELAEIGSTRRPAAKWVADLYYAPPDDAAVRHLLTVSGDVLPTRIHFGPPKYDFGRPRLGLRAAPGDPGKLVLRTLDCDPVRVVTIDWDPNDEASQLTLTRAIEQLSYEAEAHAPLPVAVALAK